MNYAIPVRHNRAILGVLLVLHVVVLFMLPSLLAHSVLWGLILLPMAWLNIVHWALIHEAIHKLLLTTTPANEQAGRVLAILMGASFHVLRFGHLMHHQLNRQFHSEMVKERTFGAQAYYYAYLTFGLYLSELVTGWMFAVLPRKQFMLVARRTFLKHEENVAVAGERFFYQRGNVRHVRTDVMASLALYGAAFYVYGAQWPWLLAFIGIRAFVISFMDNIYHFGTPEDNRKPAKELALSANLSMLILYGNYHETHHANPDVPWSALPYLHQKQGREFDGDLLLHGMMQFEGPAVVEPELEGVAHA